MVSQLDRWRTAQLLIKNHGLGAELDAAQRADKAIAAGDPETESLWRDVLIKVQQLQRTRRPDDCVN